MTLTTSGRLPQDSISNVCSTVIVQLAAAQQRLSLFSICSSADGLTSSIYAENTQSFARLQPWPFSTYTASFQKNDICPQRVAIWCGLKTTLVVPGCMLGGCRSITS